MKTAKYWIDRLKLEEHPEGGYFKEVYRSNGLIPNSVLGSEFKGDRNYSTSIYYLLNKNDISAFHKINQDETWHFYDGSALIIHMVDEQGNYSNKKIGRNPENNEVLQFTVKAGVYFAAEVIDKESYSLAGCTVAPGFDFRDFYMPDKEEFLRIFPDTKASVISLIKD